jgi:hypothetical protein
VLKFKRELFVIINILIEAIENAVYLHMQYDYEKELCKKYLNALVSYIGERQ